MKAEAMGAMVAVGKSYQKMNDGDQLYTLELSRGTTEGTNFCSWDKSGQLVVLVPVQKISPYYFLTLRSFKYLHNCQ